jgi:RNA polymerase sigma-70 factor, ECF subfamily
LPNHLTATSSASSQDDSLLTDEMLVHRARGKDASAFELLMRRHNQRLYRVVRSILREPAEVEDVMQQTYLSAFVHLDQFEGAAKWSTWLCRIGINEALARMRQHSRLVSLDAASEEAMTDLGKPQDIDPERSASGREFQQLVEGAIDRLPEGFRTILMMREIEGMTVAETAAVLEVDENVVKTRLHRARACLRETIERRVGKQLEDAFSFGHERCDRVVAGVLARLRLE